MDLKIFRMGSLAKETQFREGVLVNGAGWEDNVQPRDLQKVECQNCGIEVQTK